ncbi:MAG TPA: hypothetical protein VJ603_05385 [Paucimonas sp.]|nr:hypothetical protein [Paucimonas sp.]HJW54520.1 hypothetical protein [Burkholderiaceae bacterium]
MKTHSIITLACAVVALLAAGCQKTPEPKTTAVPSPSASVPAPSVSSNASVALPPNQVPQSDGAIPPAAANTPANANPNTPSQTNPAALSKSHEEASMPLTGQTNNYSPPDTTSQQKK